MWVLYLGGGGPRHLPLGEGGLATGRSAAAVPLELIVSSDFVKRHRLIVALLENGGLVDGVGRARKPPLALAVEAEDYRLAAILIQHNADPSCLQGSKSDSPLIEAMRLAITKGEEWAGLGGGGGGVVVVVVVVLFFLFFFVFFCFFLFFFCFVCCFFFGGGGASASA